MEIYSIVNKLTGKMYIGSTSLTKEERFFGRIPSSHMSRVSSGYESPLYHDIRTLGVDNFELTTLEYVESDKEYLRSREVEYIKTYKSLGMELYNLSVELTPFQDNEVQSKIVKSRLEKYGHPSGSLITSKSRSSLLKSLTDKYGSPTAHMMTKDIRTKAAESVKTHYMYSESVYVGRNELYEHLRNLGYELSMYQLRSFIEGHPSKKLLSKYPELENSIKYLTVTERNSGLTFDSKYGEGGSLCQS